MHLFHSSIDASKALESPILLIGNFDGVHLGHRKLINTALNHFNSDHPICMYSFDPHPAHLFSEKHFPPPPMIQTLAQKIQILQTMNIHGIVIEPFTQLFSKYRADIFFNQVILKRLKVSGIVVGYDFTFGYLRKGNTTRLSMLCKKHNIDLIVVSAQFNNDQLISSSIIRQYIQNSNIIEANQLLGRPYSITGHIIPGRGIGQTLDTPTANLHPYNRLIPKNGVYITSLSMNGITIPSITSIGINPTYPNIDFSIETHLLDADIDLYEKQVEIYFHDFIRYQKHFSSPGELKKQIHIDINSAKDFHRNNRGVL